MSLRALIKTFILLMVLTIGLAGCSSKPKNVEKAPNFDAINILSKQPISLTKFRGKVVVLEWFNNGCPFVKKFYQSSTMQKLQSKYIRKGVVWILVISSGKGKQGYVENRSQMFRILRVWNFIPSAVILDPKGTLGRLYNAKVTPQMYVVNREGDLVYQGAIDSIPSADPKDIEKATNYVAEALNQVLEGKQVSMPKTKPYGCSIKYA